MTKKPVTKKTSYSPGSRPVFCGEMADAERRAINKLPTESRLAALLSAAAKYKPAPAPKPSPKKKVVKKSAAKPKSKVKPATAVKKGVKPISQQETVDLHKEAEATQDQLPF